MDAPPPTLAAASLQGLCPKCGAATLFSGVARFAPECSACGLDYQRFNVGDGPAAFLILIVGALVCGGAIALELAVEPRWWVHMVWLPVAALLTVGGLRIGKAALLFQEYHQRAGEGRRAK